MLYSYPIFKNDFKRPLWTIAATSSPFQGWLELCCGQEVPVPVVARGGGGGGGSRGSPGTWGDGRLAASPGAPLCSPLGAPTPLGHGETPPGLCWCCLHHAYLPLEPLALGQKHPPEDPGVKRQLR